ncbi:galactose-1-epimerase, partial [Pseudoalteromonas sp. S2721]
IQYGVWMDVCFIPFFFLNAKVICLDIKAINEQLKLGKGYVLNFVLKDTPSYDLVEAATDYAANSGRTLTVYTEEPGVQFYSGIFLDGSTPQASGLVHNFRSGFCLEPHHFPDGPNQPTFPSTPLLPRS